LNNYGKNHNKQAGRTKKSVLLFFGSQVEFIFAVADLILWVQEHERQKQEPFSADISVKTELDKKPCRQESGL